MNIQYYDIAYGYRDLKVEEDLQVGEIIGHRAWKLRNGFLHSMYADHSWEPQNIERAHKISYSFGDGIHAYKTMEECYSQYPFADVFGEIKMWGQVWEFENGWHTEFARVHRITRVSSDIPILHLRKRKLNRLYGATK